MMGADMLLDPPDPEPAEWVVVERHTPHRGRKRVTLRVWGPYTKSGASTVQIKVLARSGPEGIREVRIQKVERYPE